MQKDNILFKGARFLNDYGLELIDIVITGLGYALIGIVFSIDPEKFEILTRSQVGFSLLVLVFIGNLVITFLLIKKREGISELTEKNNGLSYKVQTLENDIDKLYSDFFRLFNDQLAIIFHRLDFTANERISVYRHKGNSFELISRYSKNTSFNATRRKIFPDNEGFISKAWESEKGEFQLQTLPAFRQGSKKHYVSEITKYCSMDRETLKGMRMKSRSYYLRCITDSTNLQRKAIIVFESLDNHRFKIDEINQILEDEDQRLTLFIEKVKTKDRISNLATEKGF